jgi:DNA-binding protein H-NS
LLDHVEAPAALQARLKAVGVVEAEALDALAARLLPGQRLVTLDGALRRWDGFASEAGAPSAAAVRLETRNRLSELTPQLETARRGAERSQTAAEEAQQARLNADAALNQARITSNRLKTSAATPSRLCPPPAPRRRAPRRGAPAWWNRSDARKAGLKPPASCISRPNRPRPRLRKMMTARTH